MDDVVGPRLAQAWNLGGGDRVAAEVGRAPRLGAGEPNESVGGRVVAELGESEVEVVAGDRADRAVADRLLRVPRRKEVVAEFARRRRPELDHHEIGEAEQHVAGPLLDGVAEVALAAVHLHGQVGQERSGVRRAQRRQALDRDPRVGAALGDRGPRPEAAVGVGDDVEVGDAVAVVQEGDQLRQGGTVVIRIPVRVDDHVRRRQGRARRRAWIRNRNAGAGDRSREDRVGCGRVLERRGDAVGQAPVRSLLALAGIVRRREGRLGLEARDEQDRLGVRGSRMRRRRQQQGSGHGQQDCGVPDHAPLPSRPELPHRR